MLRESIGGILAGIGVLFAVATSIAAGFAISSWDFYWYYQSGQGMEERYSWDGRQLYQVEAGTGRTNFVQFESWSQLGYEALPALYATTQSLMVASICFSGLAVLAFLAVGFLRWFYRYQVVHLEPADKPRRTGRFRNEEERQQRRQTHRQDGTYEEDDDGDYDDDDDDDDDEDKEYRVRPTYRSWRKNAIIRYFADRDRHGWSLLISEWVSVIFALLSLALLIAAVAVFASQHADKMKSDLSLNGCLSPGPCESLAGDEGLSSSVLVRSWRPGVGWAWATATLAFAAGSLLVAVAQFTVRNNRFMSEDPLQRDVDLERADPQGFFFSEYELLSQSHVWQGQEKAFHKQDGWYQPLVDPHPFPASEQSISHQYREDP